MSNLTIDGTINVYIDTILGRKKKNSWHTNQEYIIKKLTQPKETD